MTVQNAARFQWLVFVILYEVVGEDEWEDRKKMGESKEKEKGTLVIIQCFPNDHKPLLHQMAGRSPSVPTVACLQFMSFYPLSSFSFAKKHLRLV